MPMQPSPTAETSGPFLPRVRFFIVSSPSGAWLAVDGSRYPWSGPVLLVTDLFHPVDGLAVERFGDRDVCHRRGGSGPVPVLLARLEPDHVARPDHLDRTTLTLHPAAAEGDDQRLPERVRVPRGARAGLEGDDRAADTGRLASLKWRVDAYRTGKIFGGTLGRRLRTISCDLHGGCPFAGRGPACLVTADEMSRLLFSGCNHMRLGVKMRMSL